MKRRKSIAALLLGSDSDSDSPERNDNAAVSVNTFSDAESSSTNNHPEESLLGMLLGCVVTGWFHVCIINV